MDRRSDFTQLLIGDVIGEELEQMDFVKKLTCAN
jgi:hypothetical protein